MKRKTIFYYLLFLFAILSESSFSQNLVHSESIIKYDLSNLSTDKPIPFDRSFTLDIEKLSSKNIDSVFVFQADFKKNKRYLVTNTYLNETNKKETSSIKDITLKINPYSETLQIFFPPLKPNVHFDINIVYKLSEKNKQLLMKTNGLIFQGDFVKAEAKFNEFLDATTDKIYNRTYNDITYVSYKSFYDTKLAINYVTINGVNQNDDGKLDKVQIQAIDSTYSKYYKEFPDGNLLIEVTRKNLWKDLQLGLRDITLVYSKDSEALTNPFYGDQRVKNLEVNITFFDNLIKQCNKVSSKGINSMTINENVIIIDNVRDDIEKIKNNCLKNLNLLKVEVTNINEVTAQTLNLREGVYLSGNTESKDLKTAGGNVLFLDAGLTTIMTTNLNNQIEYIPKLYWGVSIYFRPIDKNTRRNRFASEFDPGLKDGYYKNSKGQVTYGPDYGVVTKRSIWQNLSLNVGLTIGSYSNKDYDNLYNSNSLLIGPAYRFARAFKISSGVALLKRSSTSPLVSEKEIVAAGYLSLSVDIDFIQGIKDVTSILLK